MLHYMHYLFGMKTRVLLLTTTLFALLVLGMFVFAYLYAR